MRESAKEHVHAGTDACAPFRLGIFAKVFVRPTLEAVLDAVAQHGVQCIQFNFSCAGLPNMPERMEPALLDRIRQAFEERNLKMSAVSGTFNMIHPDLKERRQGLLRLRELTSACPRLGTSVVTLCSGTRDPENMWRGHPENNSPTAWRDLCHSLAKALSFAEEFGITLGVEPEVSNVVDSARKARRLLDEMHSLRLKIIMDGANLFHTGELPRMRQILDEAFDLLGRDIVIAHAKDLRHDGEAGNLAAGAGVLDYDHYLALLRAAGFDGPLILHGLSESQVAGCLAFLRGKMKAMAGVDSRSQGEAP
ncbi:MAG: sugar phosphate isomerase/epimerase [Chloroflexi bacterium]|nr:sugar phosphate isomerase/epimerase [Chloroflexota bacterium]